MIQPKPPRRRIYEQLTRLEKLIDRLEYLVYTKKNYLQYLPKYKKYHPLLQQTFIEINAHLQILMFGWIYRSEKDYQRLLKKARKKYMNVLQLPISKNLKRSIKNIHYIFKQIKLPRILTLPLINKAIQKIYPEIGERYHKNYLQLKTLLEELNSFEKEVIKILEKPKNQFQTSHQHSAS